MLPVSIFVKQVKLELFSTKTQMFPPFRNKKSQNCIFKCYEGNNLIIIHVRVMVLVVTRRLNVVYKCMKFRCNTSNGYQVIERTRNTIVHDQRAITQKISKADLWFLFMTHGLIVL